MCLYELENPLRGSTREILRDDIEDRKCEPRQTQHFQRFPARGKANKPDCIYTYGMPTKRDRLLKTERQNALPLYPLGAQNGNSRRESRRDDGHITGGNTCVAPKHSSCDFNSRSR